MHDDSPKAKYEPVDPDAAAAAEWQQLYHAAGPWVASHHHVITGSVLPVWNKIQEREGSGKDANRKTRSPQLWLPTLSNAPGETCDDALK